MPAEPTVNVPQTDSPSLPIVLARAWHFAAWIAGLFSLIVGLLLIVGYVRIRSDNPLSSIALADLKAKLREAPTEQPLKDEIRQADFAQRNRYFKYQSRKRVGVFLLIGGVAAFVLSMGARDALRKSFSQPKPDSGNPTASIQSRARWSVATTGAAVASLLLAVAIRWTPAVPQASGLAATPAEGSSTAGPDFAPGSEYAANWPRFRGPDGNGFFAGTNLPSRWDSKTGNGVVWKVPVPGQGVNSPIVWHESVYLSAADATEHSLICVERKSGKTIWKQTLPPTTTTAPEIQRPPATGYAAPSVATDGRRVYAIFSDAELSAFSLDGKLLWVKNLGPPKNSYGHASSVATWRDRVIVQLDQGESEESKSRLFALDGRTGDIIWQRPRKVGASWASPLVVDAGSKAQVITLAVPHAIAYDATSGAELWRVEGLNGEITPSPAFAEGLIFALSPSEKLLAIKPDGTGNITRTHCVWTNEDGIPDITSPATDGRLLFNLTSSGVLTCLDVKDGKKQWEHDLELEFHASPAVADGKLYLFGLKGTALIVEAGRQFRELFRTEMGEGFEASPAFADGQIFVRGETNLWCLGSFPERLVSK
jgi:outer membrane protein assembly factor BamB